MRKLAFRLTSGSLGPCLHLYLLLEWPFSALGALEAPPPPPPQLWPGALRMAHCEARAVSHAGRSECVSLVNSFVGYSAGSPAGRPADQTNKQFCRAAFRPSCELLATIEWRKVQSNCAKKLPDQSGAGRSVGQCAIKRNHNDNQLQSLVVFLLLLLSECCLSLGSKLVQQVALGQTDGLNSGKRAHASLWPAKTTTTTTTTCGFCSHTRASSRADCIKTAESEQANVFPARRAARRAWPLLEWYKEREGRRVGNFEKNLAHI